MAQQFIDIGANLTDDNYMGIYHQVKCHEPDLETVIKRSEKEGLSHIIITAGKLKDLKDALNIIATYQPKTNVKLCTTVGVHPTWTHEITDDYLNELVDLAEKNREHIVAIGEVGLDYCRLEFADKDTQIKGYRKQIALLHEKFPDLPYFFHCREAFDDFNQINHELNITGKGVVHSFNSDLNYIKNVLKEGWDVGINGLAFRSQESFDAVKEIPIDRLHFETDCPYCDIKSSFVGYPLMNKRPKGCKHDKYNPDKLVIGRNEPCKIIDVAVIASKVLKVDLYALCQQVHQNSMKMFFPEK